jgi:hypothetical protein
MIDKLSLIANEAIALHHASWLCGDVLEGGDFTSCCDSFFKLISGSPYYVPEGFAKFNKGTVEDCRMVAIAYWCQSVGIDPTDLSLFTNINED